MIKYLGSKRTLVPILGALARGAEAQTAVDLFTGTTRVAQEFKRLGLHVTAADLASYSAVLAECYIAADSVSVDHAALTQEIDRLNALPPTPGYFTRTFCEEARFFQPKNGARVDAIRDAIEADHRGGPWYPILLTSLMLAADRVDSTAGQQMAYLKQWAPRAHKDLELRCPTLLPGSGTALRGDAEAVVDQVPPVDLMYLDPPYNQHRYFTNYHVWETLVRWDEPAHYGVACKRIDSRDDHTKSAFNQRQRMPVALQRVIARARADVVVVSYNDESWIDADQMTSMLLEAGRECVRLLSFDRRRYIGAQIGVHNPQGQKVGEVSRLRNVEYVFVAGERERVDAAVAMTASQALTQEA